MSRTRVAAKQRIPCDRDLLSDAVVAEPERQRPDREHRCLGKIRWDDTLQNRVDANCHTEAMVRADAFLRLVARIGCSVCEGLAERDADVANSVADV